jgi:nucleotide-binding universal stress UspA family protein
VSTHRRIVVGVDGSECSGLALRWAADQAVQRGATLVVVTTWTALPPPIVHPYAGFPEHTEGDPQEAALLALERALEPVLEEKPDLSVEKVAVAGDPAKVLIEQSQDAELVVVGVSGSGGIGGWLVGSVSRKLVQHAACSVAVIR